MPITCSRLRSTTAPGARPLVDAPARPEIDNYANNEKIAYLPRKLTEEGSGSFSNEAPGDLCYYAPWGNLAFFYAGYRYSAGLIRLGRLDGGVEPCSNVESFHPHRTTILKIMLAPVLPCRL